jgi:hypothetical protein
MMIHSEILPAYRRIRQLGVRLNHKLMKTLSNEAIQTAGEKLGIRKNGILVFDSEDETSVLMDYAIYNVRIGGQNAVERYLDQSPPTPDSDEMALLNAMLEAYYSLFQIVDAERGVGVTVRDLLRAETHFMADIGFSNSAPTNSVLASRVIPLEEHGFIMSGGAGLPTTQPTVARITSNLVSVFGPNADFGRLTPDMESELAAIVIRVCLESGMSSFIEYGFAAEMPRRSKPSVDPREVRRANRNEPCPCGSGRKFKTCCGRRPRL